MQLIQENKKCFLPIILTISLLLRFSFLALHPDGVNQDELSNIYDAWSISETGSDRFDTNLPWELRAFGNADYRPSLFTYLLSLVFLIFGKSVFIARSFSILIGVLGIYILDKFIQQIKLSETSRLIALTLISFSPWHIIFSATALEGTVLAPTLFIFCVYLFSRYKDSFNHKRLLILSASLALFSFSYQSAKLIAALFGLFVFLYILFKNKDFQKSTLFALACLILTSPYTYELIYFPEQFFGRANNSATDIQPFYTYGIVYILENFGNNLSSGFLFFELNKALHLSPYRLLIAEFIFFYFGILTINKNRKNLHYFLWFLTFICLLPTCFTIENPHPIRIAPFLYLAPLFTALGYSYLKGYFSKGIKYIFIIGITGSIYFQYKVYFNTESLQVGYQPNLTSFYQDLNKKNISHPLYIEDHGNQPYIYHLYYSNTHPNEFKSTKKDLGERNGKYDKVNFIGNVNWCNSNEIDSLIKTNANGTFIFKKDSLKEVYPSTDQITTKDYTYSIFLVN